MGIQVLRLRLDGLDFTGWRYALSVILQLLNLFLEEKYQFLAPLWMDIHVLIIYRPLGQYSFVIK
jgi:hypothetical protein